MEKYLNKTRTETSSSHVLSKSIAWTTANAHSQLTCDQQNSTRLECSVWIFVKSKMKGFTFINRKHKEGWNKFWNWIGRWILEE